MKASSIIILTIIFLFIVLTSEGLYANSHAKVYGLKVKGFQLGMTKQEALQSLHVIKENFQLDNDSISDMGNHVNLKFKEDGDYIFLVNFICETRYGSNFVHSIAFYPRLFNVKWKEGQQIYPAFLAYVKAFFDTFKLKYDEKNIVTDIIGSITLKEDDYDIIFDRFGGTIAFKLNQNIINDILMPYKLNEERQRVQEVNPNFR